MRGLVSVVLAAVVLVTAVSGVAIAQQSGSGGGGSGGGGGGNLVGNLKKQILKPIQTQLSNAEKRIKSAIPSPSAITKNVINALPDILTQPITELTSWVNGALGMAASSLTSLLNDVVKLATFVPAPGNPTNPTTWTPVDGSGSPRNTIWGDVYEATKTNMGLAIIILAFSGTLNFRYGNAVKRRKAWKAWAVSFTMVVLTWFLAPFGLHLASTLAAGYTPGASQFLQGFASFSKLGYGIIVGAVILVIYPTVAFVALLSVGIQVFLLLVAVFFWPIGWACLSFEEGYMHSLGKFVVNLYSGLLALNIAQAMVLHLLFSVDFTQSSVIGTSLSLVMIPGGVLFATVLLPWGMLKQISTGVGVDLGMRSMSYKAERAGRYASKVGPKVQKRLDQIEKTGRAYRSAKSRVRDFFSRDGSDGDDPDDPDGPPPPPPPPGASALVPSDNDDPDDPALPGAPPLPSGDSGSSSNPVPLPAPDDEAGDDPDDGDDGWPDDGGPGPGDDRPVWQRIDRETRRRRRDRRDYIQNNREW